MLKKKKMAINNFSLPKKLNETNEKLFSKIKGLCLQIRTLVVNINFYVDEFFLNIF